MKRSCRPVVGRVGRCQTTTRRPTVCANCGCGTAEDMHGDQRNIAWSDIEAAAAANDQTPEQAIENMRDMARSQAAGG